MALDLARFDHGYRDQPRYRLAFVGFRIKGQNSD
jgi:hypothetical protein